MNKLNNIICTASIACCGVLSGCDSVINRTDTDNCNSLTGIQSTFGVIEKAELVEEGKPFIGFFKRAFLKFAAPGFPEMRASANFCRVTAKLHPEPGSEITAEVWLPEKWNGKMVGSGGAGFNGGLSGAGLSLNSPLKKGYAGLVTDAGHPEDVETFKFAYDSSQQLIDYAYRANEVGTLFAKSLIARYYGNPVEHAYFMGCSNGGRDGLMLAQRLPDEYDGIIAGAPAAGYSKLAVSFAWNQQAALTAPGLKEKLTLISDAVIKRCDTIDGVADGILENPLQCDFDPAELLCKNGSTSNCLLENEVAALTKIYEGPRLDNGNPVYPGLSAGGESLESNWDEWVMGNVPIAAELFRWAVYKDPNWDIGRFEIDKDYSAAVEQMGPILDADDPDLSEYFGSDGKLILYHGWNDAGIPSRASVNYVEAIHGIFGDSAENHVKLFMVPGLMHCAGGVGATSFDMFDHLVEWVEEDKVPEQVIAMETDPPSFFGLVRPDVEVIRTHPLCPWPQVAIYNDKGSITEAESYSCGIPEGVSNTKAVADL
ncbi:tannase/feruloyl esterase family alpha/beta hydrolase [Microbulbifer sp. SH-1]|uniref:tannase/feruloyl esterase family alpha/beta hydrolase n=1 Tax=Microbulbifer sp. SH-1 TaxID=2681547 RepID=UPI0014091082|nr:tannase/feruloyl esterase family alpha/beta hydrolase [Microbulbifer sp. SH-1]QIL91271.1 tannase/feruloyl esterase family alpha/beta hydrolase [Microbulbifer sp. SH-1]